MDERKIFEELTIVPLLTRFVRGEELTALETKTIEIWIGANKSNKEIFERLKDEEQLAKDLYDFSSTESENTEALLKLKTELTKHTSRKRFGKYWRTAIAVIFAFALVTTIHYYFNAKDELQDNIEITTADISPGKNRATLAFDDGQVLDLEGKTVKSDANGVTYVDGKALSLSKMQFATLTTPRKGQYKAVLPDGTTVWLNAESKLKYPTKFTGAERLVKLEGEGYFEVAHDASRPFIVESEGQRVKVLGTKFNINSYTNEEYTRTTLISGSVELRNLQNELLVTLKPGEQGRFVLGGIDVKKVDTESFIGWKENEFQYNGAQLIEVLRQLERWYDVDVDYSNVPHIKVYATISRDKKLRSVLFALGEITDLNFKLTGRRIEIKK